ncbi:MAG: ribonuclease P protein component 4 [Candidatus Nanohaloarchaea archaeon]
MPEDIAKERIERLFELAERRMSSGHEDLADRYVEIARRIGMREQVSIPSERQKQFCSRCKAFLMPGKNCRVRIDSKKSTVNYECENCGNIDRYGFKD